MDRKKTAATNSKGKYNAYGAVKDIVIDGITYYDIENGIQDGRVSSADTLAFLMKAMEADDYLQKWGQLAYQIIKCQGNQKGYFVRDAKESFDSAFGKNGFYFDFIKRIGTEERTGEHDRDSTLSTGLSVAASLSDVLDAACYAPARMIDRKVTAADFRKHHSIEALNDTTEQTVLYSLVSNTDRDGTSPLFRYNTFGIAFYDFKLAGIVDEHPFNTAVGNLSLEQAIKRKDALPGFSYEETYNKQLSQTENQSRVEVAGEATLTNTTTTTASNTVTTTESYGLEKTIGYEVAYTQKWGCLGGVVEGDLTISFNAGFTTQQVFETAYGQEKSVTKERGQSNTVSVPMPPHTIQNIIQNTSGADVLIAYDCPVAILFKVAIFSLCGKVYTMNTKGNNHWETAGYFQSSFATTFGNEDSSTAAVRSLYSRAIKNKDVGGYELSCKATQGTKWKKGTWCDCLNWDEILSQPETSSEAAGMMTPEYTIEWLTKNIPMSVSGAEIEEKVNCVVSQVEDMQPLFDLKKIKLTKGKKMLDMKVGDILDMDDFELTGLDAENVEYYGFSADKGYWEIVSGADIVDLSQEGSLKAKKEGEAKLEYRIQEGAYKAYGKMEVKNTDIETAYIEIIVS